jgi:hypothetical protein
VSRYGYVTTTNVKLIIVVDEYSEIKDPEVKSVSSPFPSSPSFIESSLLTPSPSLKFFEKFYTVYVNTVSNPFYNIDEEITSKKFELEVARLVALNSN